MLAELQVLPNWLEANPSLSARCKLRQASAYFRFSTIENVDILGEGHISRLHKQLGRGCSTSPSVTWNTVTKDGTTMR